MVSNQKPVKTVNTPLCNVWTALRKGAADSSQSEESIDTTSSREFMLMSPQPDDASSADPNDAGAMCSALDKVNARTMAKVHACALAIVHLRPPLSIWASQDVLGYLNVCKAWLRGYTHTVITNHIYKHFVRRNIQTHAEVLLTLLLPLQLRLETGNPGLVSFTP